MGRISLWAAGFAIAIAATLASPALAQVRVVVDGQVQDVPAGVLRTITYAPDGRQIVRDTPFAGRTAPDCATVTTTETTDEDGDGNTIQTTVVTRIEPMVAVAWAAPAPPLPATYTPPQPAFFADPPAPHLDVDADALELQAPASSVPYPLKLHRDPMTGHFIATIRINGVPVRAIIDTGAQSTILSARDARATGADREITRSEPMAGIGGYSQLAVTRVHSMEVAGQQLGGFTAAIGAEGIPYTLLGQTEIARLGRIVIENGIMTIAARGTQMAAR
jgi:clan AA aspartic protease (TIGR02281 family)